MNTSYSAFQKPRCLIRSPPCKHHMSSTLFFYYERSSPKNNYYVSAYFIHDYYPTRRPKTGTKRRATGRRATELRRRPCPRMRGAMLFERERSLAPGINICASKYRARRRSGSSAGGVVVVALLSGSAGQGSPRLAQCQLRSRRGWCSRGSCASRVDLVLFLLSRPGAMTDSATGGPQAP